MERESREQGEETEEKRKRASRRTNKSSDSIVKQRKTEFNGEREREKE